LFGHTSLVVILECAIAKIFTVIRIATRIDRLHTGRSIRLASVYVAAAVPSLRVRTLLPPTLCARVACAALSRSPFRGSIRRGSATHRHFSLLLLVLLMPSFADADVERHVQGHHASTVVKVHGSTQSASAQHVHTPLKPSIRAARAARASASSVGKIILCTLAVQNAAQMLSMRYSRMPGQPRYLSSTAVVFAEALKLLASFGVLAWQQGLGGAATTVWNGLVLAWRDTLLVGVPAMLYLVQNNLLYMATTHLDAATCQVAYQLKLLTTAFFTVTLLKRHISTRRWLALGILFCGVVFVQNPSGGKGGGGLTSQSPVLGMAAVTCACVLSGLAGVWLERIVKSSNDVPIWLRNMQLGSISLFLGIVSVFVVDGEAVAADGFFQGYSWVTFFVVVQVSLGGLLVSLIMKYADNVVKGFATSLSIVLSSLVSWFIPSFNFVPSASFLVGSSLVIAATLLYSTIPAKAASASAAADAAAARAYKGTDKSHEEP